MQAYVDPIQDVLDIATEIGRDIENGCLDVHVIAGACKARRLADLEPDATAASGVIGGFDD